MEIIVKALNAPPDYRKIKNKGCTGSNSLMVKAAQDMRAGLISSVFS